MTVAVMRDAGPFRHFPTATGILGLFLIFRLTFWHRV